MPALSSFDYAIVRVVPRVERGEFVNAGAMLFCRTRRFLGAEMALHSGRLLVLDPEVDVVEVERQLALIEEICRGDDAGGPLAALPIYERFHWLTAPRSTVIQTSAVHSGLCRDPRATLSHLVDAMVVTP